MSMVSDEQDTAEQWTAAVESEWWTVPVSGRSCMGEISYHVDQELEDGSQRFQFRLPAVQ